MANVIKKATNRFTKGLVMDFSPENTKNEVLTHALNATLLTFNGNEMSLQNDMGNARVETAYLPEGYMPVGTCEYGGIIYIVSYNPLEDKSQIGCFPSPERNISSDELGIPQVHISKEDFQELDENAKLTGVLKHNTQYVLLKNSNLNPGDKFLICSDHTIYSEQLENLLVKKDPKCDSTGVKDKDGYELVENPILTLNVVSIEESGKIVYLNSDIRRYEVPNQDSTDGKECISAYKYHILGTGGLDGKEFDQQDVDIDSYRNALSSGYSVFKSKTSGKLAILAELIMIDSYSVTHSLQACVDEQGNTIDGKFDVVIHTEVEPSVTNNNYTTVPKLKYYYLNKSQGYLQYYDSDTSETISTRLLFEEDKDGKILQKRSNLFLNTPLSSIYTQTGSINLEKPLRNECQFNFPYTDTYHGNMIPYNGDNLNNETIYTKFTEGKYHRFNKSQIQDNIEYFQNNFKFYKYVEGESGYQAVDENHTISDEHIYYVKIPSYEYIDAQRSDKYKNEELYKLTTSALVATQKEINDSQIEKFEYQSKVRYEIATDEQLALGKNLWYKSDPESLEFTSLTGAIDPTVTYYVEISQRYLVSKGYVIDSDSITGILYYYPTTKNYKKATNEDKIKYYDTVTYPLAKDPPYGSPITLYYQKTDYVYKPATKEQIENSSQTGVQLFFDLNYSQVSDISKYVDSNQLFMEALVDTYLPYDQFKPSTEYNYINGYNNEIDKYEKEYPLYLFTISDFIPELSDSETYTPYQDLKLGTIQLPSVVYNYGVDLPFKYDYTIVPCMNYGRLDHLAVSNTVDFSKLHAFNRSSFTTWKYRIDDGYLRLTIGAEIFDTYETNKVDGLIFEFYDHRGFAGSFEFVDKKSYNGIFTKVIPLNSLYALSQKMIVDRSQVTTYKRNINIIEQYTDDYTGEYSFNNQKVIYKNYLDGWDINDADNDCGTIYSNVIYGVKTYLRRTTKDGVEYIRKQDMFVYTLPLFNEYYYKINNFMTINNPQLQFMLTYKVVDESTKRPYNSDNIKQGYNSKDTEQVNAYISGFYNTSQSTKLDLIKYYQYSGTTNLYLEVGLKQEYTDINLAYNPKLNEYFTCELQLISDTDSKSTYSVVSDSSELTEPKSILNYNANGLDLNINKLLFAYTDSTGLSVEKADLPIENGRLVSSNFIHNQGNNPIKITYDFIVGYTVNISNIRKTNVPATTVCALFHETQDGEDNCIDFGIYKQDDGQGGYQYLSDAIFYNGGTADQEEFGLCRQIKTNGANMLEECHKFSTEFTDAKKHFNAWELNSGKPLEKMVPYLGKLAFCQPHAHGMSGDNGVNIHETKQSNGSYLYGIPPGTEAKYATHGQGDDYEYGYGIVPRDFLYYKPKYNLCLNTKNAIVQKSEFISTLDYNIIAGNVLGVNMNHSYEQNWNYDMPMRDYTGFTGAQIELFNKKLLKTMSKVYAYNPDYDSLQINLGDITLQKYNPKFISNIISLNSQFNFGKNTLNDYIYISNLNLTKYLTDLNKYSVDNSGNSITIKNGEQVINHLQFTVDYTYCGTKLSPYLINQLTYNTVVPVEIEEELMLNKSDLIVVKHTDNTNSFISGNLNKNLLYGYNAEYNKLITLDVSNYQINVDGDLILDGSGTKKELELEYIIDKDVSKALYPIDGTHSETFTPEWEDGLSEEITVTLNLNKNNFLLTRLKFVENTGEFFLTSDLVDRSVDMLTVSLKPRIEIKNNKKYDYQVYINSIELKCGNRALGRYALNNTGIVLSQQSEETLKNLIFGSLDDTIKYTTYFGDVFVKNKDLWVYDAKEHQIRIRTYDPYNSKYYDPNLEHSIMLNQSGMNIDTLAENFSTVSTALYYFKINKIKYKLVRISKLESDPNDIIINNKTTNYSKLEHDYVVLPKYKQTRIRGTSITLNDLVYDPSNSGHRLFMRNNCAIYNSKLRGKLYYRYLNDQTWTDTPTGNVDKSRLHDSWKYWNTKDLNYLCIMTGPCFTENNLEVDPDF